MSYTFLMIAYTKNVVTSIYNYYMIPVVEQIKLRWEEDKRNEASRDGLNGDGKYIGDEDDGEILDSWIFDEDDWEDSDIDGDEVEVEDQG